MISKEFLRDVFIVHNTSPQASILRAGIFHTGAVPVQMYKVCI
ncbi:hypothetical protein [Gallintestinimicrobium sp.]